MRRLMLGIAVLALITTACRAEVRIQLGLEADGSGTVAIATGFDEEFEELVFQGQDPQEVVFQDNELTDVEGAATSVFEEGDLTFYMVTVPFDDPDDLRQMAEGEEDAFSALVEGTIDMEGSGLSEDLDGEVGDFDPDLLEDVLKLVIRIDMPGEVTDTNADNVRGGGTLEWDVPLTSSSVDILAVSDPTGGGDGGFPWLILIIVLWQRQARSGGSTAGAPADTSGSVTATAVTPAASSVEVPSAATLPPAAPIGTTPPPAPPQGETIPLADAPQAPPEDPTATEQPPVAAPPPPQPAPPPVEPEPEEEWTVPAAETPPPPPPAPPVAPDEDELPPPPPPPV